MRKKLTEPFGKAGLTVAVLALVLAMVGGAYAAGGLTKAQEKQVTKIAKKYAGKPGAAGATGPAGPGGAPGGPGPAGKAGGPGPEGPEGSPWTAGGTLPSGRTLKGEWNADSVTVAPFTALHTAISYALSLSSAPTVHYVKVGEASPTGCTGGTVANPAAEKGNLCIYAAVEEPGVVGISPEAGLDPLVGFSLFAASTAPAGEFASFNGTWAVTAE
jgi:hypothetical protein